MVLQQKDFEVSRGLFELIRDDGKKLVIETSLAEETSRVEVEIENGHLVLTDFDAVGGSEKVEVAVTRFPDLLGFVLDYVNTPETRIHSVRII